LRLDLSFQDLNKKVLPWRTSQVLCTSSMRSRLLCQIPHTEFILDPCCCSPSPGATGRCNGCVRTTTNAPYARQPARPDRTLLDFGSLVSHLPWLMALSQRFPWLSLPSQLGAPLSRSSAANFCTSNAFRCHTCFPSYRSLLASLSDSSRHRMSSTFTGPLTFRMMLRLVSSMNSTLTCVTPPREPVRPRTRVTLTSLTGTFPVASILNGCVQDRWTGILEA